MEIRVLIFKKKLGKNNNFIFFKDVIDHEATVKACLNYLSLKRVEKKTKSTFSKLLQ